MRAAGLAMLESLELDAVLFDLDGTLIDSSAAIRRAWRTMAAGQGLGAGFEFTEHGVPARDVVAGLLPADRVEGALAEVQRLEEEDTAGIVPLPGTADLLASLAGRPWAIVTSCTAPLAEARIAAAGLPAPPVLVTADDVARGKPAPQPYLLAALLSGADPERCLAFEDAPSGVASALAAGCWCVGVATTHPADRLVAHGVVASLADVAFQPGPRLVPSFRRSPSGAG